jgi:hypothetical protein
VGQRHSDTMRGPTALTHHTQRDIGQQHFDAIQGSTSTLTLRVSQRQLQQRAVTTPPTCAIHRQPYYLAQQRAHQVFLSTRPPTLRRSSQWTFQLRSTEQGFFLHQPPRQTHQVHCPSRPPNRNRQFLSGASPSSSAAETLTPSQSTCRRAGTPGGGGLRQTKGWSYQDRTNSTETIIHLLRRAGPVLRHPGRRQGATSSSRAQAYNACQGGSVCRHATCSHNSPVVPSLDGCRRQLLSRNSTSWKGTASHTRQIALTPRSGWTTPSRLPYTFLQLIQKLMQLSCRPQFRGDPSVLVAGVRASFTSLGE